MSNKISLQYVAGFIDGEGCFQYETTAKIHVKNTYKPILNMLKRKFGGKVAPSSYRGQPANWRPGYRWVICGESTVKVIQSVLKYLVEKKPQAKLVIKINALKSHRFRPLSEDNKIKKAEFIKELKRLKHLSS